MHFGPVPEDIHACLHFMKLAEDHDERNIVVAYYARMSAIQLAMKIIAGPKKPEVSQYLMAIMDWLEKAKSENAEVEGIGNETVAQAVIEEYMIKLYRYAYNCDCNGNFHKNMVKAYYTVSLLCDVLTQFGKLSEDIELKLNTARQRATYLHNSLKNGVKPERVNLIHVQTDEEEKKYLLTLDELNHRRALRGEDPITDERPKRTEEELAELRKKIAYFKEQGNPEYEAELQKLEDEVYNDDVKFPVNMNINLIPEHHKDGNWEELQTPLIVVNDGPILPGMPPMPPPYIVDYRDDENEKIEAEESEDLDIRGSKVEAETSDLISSALIATLNPEQTEKALKYCKWASSALNYDDTKTAVMNLEKALFLCKYGKEKQ